MEGRRGTLAIGICDSSIAVACRMASVTAKGNRPLTVSCSDGVLLGGQENVPDMATALQESFIVPDGCECAHHHARSAMTVHHDALFRGVFMK